MECGIKRILQFSVAIQYQSIKLFDADGIDITGNCMYSWSTDMVCWTNWTTYSNYKTICSTLDTDFYLRVLLFGSFDKAILGDSVTDCYNICLDNSNPFLQDFCGQTNLFQPYNNLDCALLLQQQLSNSIICMFGIPIYYLRVQPNSSSADYTFKEYALHDIVDIKQIKLMVPDGTMPSSNPKLTDFDFDWESDWEVEIGKTQFAQAFGDNIVPKQRDLVYVPLMKRLWEVNSAYDEKNEGLLWRPTTWKLAMVKYNEKTNIDQGDFESIIDGWTVNKYEEVFGERERNEQERLTGSSQIDSPRRSSNNTYNIFLEDAVRSAYSKDMIEIADKLLYHRTGVVARNMYYFAEDDSIEGPAEVIYQHGICGENGTLMFVMETGEPMPDLAKKPIIKFGELIVYIQGGENYSLSMNDLVCAVSPRHTYMVIIRWNKSNFSTEMNIYEYKYRDDIPSYLIKPEMHFFDFENPVCELVSSYNQDFESETPKLCSICGWPVGLSNIKYYNKYLKNDAATQDIEAIKEAIKYTTQHENNVIIDLARPIASGLGYSVR